MDANSDRDALKRVLMAAFDFLGKRKDGIISISLTFLMYVGAKYIHAACEIVSKGIESKKVTKTKSGLESMFSEEELRTIVSDESVLGNLAEV